jgi:hypothetical protein
MCLSKNNMNESTLLTEHDDATNCECCGKLATHLHVDRLQPIAVELCDDCCDKNCSHFTEAYWRSRTVVANRSEPPTI